MFFNCLKNKRILSSGLIVIYCVLNNNFFYTQLAFAFVLQIDSYYAFCFFLLQRDFDIFCLPLFGVCLCVFDNRYLSFSNIENKLMKDIFRKVQKVIVICELFKLF